MYGRRGKRESTQFDNVKVHEFRFEDGKSALHYLYELFIKNTCRKKVAFIENKYDIRKKLFCPILPFNRDDVLLMDDEELFQRKEEFFKNALLVRHVEAVKFLQEFVDVKIHEFRFEDGKSTLHHLYETEWYKARFDVNGTAAKEVVNYFLEDSKENHQDDHGYTYLHAACMTGNLEAVLRFICQGVDVNIDTWEFSPLYVSVEFRHSDVVEMMLLDHEANPNRQPLEISTALHALAWPRFLCDKSSD
ncbi:hypothetical protein TKK_0005645 [Trichogramma kaykai]